MMKDVQKMQGQMQQTQADLAAREVVASVGADRVKVRANGSGDIQKIEIAPELLEAGDAEMLEDLVLSGVQQAQAKAKEMMAAEMGKLAGGLGLPPGLGL